MDIVRALVLGVVQGLTEFLPVSSSGHLVLVRSLAGWGDEGLAFDAALHLGTLVALLLVFRRTCWALLRGENRQLLWLLMLGTLPAAVAGFFGEPLVATRLRAPLAIGLAFLVTAVLLAAAERVARRRLRAPVLTLSHVPALLVGLAQALALLPGISRSGTTIAAGMFLGLPRPQAVEFSFLLALPITAAAGAEGLRQVSAAASGSLLPLAVGFLAAFLAGYAAINFLLRTLRSSSLLPYAAYLLLVGVWILVRG